MSPTPRSVSTRLLLFVAPLFLVSVLVAILGTKYSFHEPDIKFQSNDGRFMSPSVAVNQQDIKVADGRDAVLTNDSTITSTSNIPHFIIDSPDNASFVKESSRIHTKLDDLEVGLQKARTAIRDAIWGNETRVRDQDYLLPVPIYWNSKAFQRSYIEMEKQFKVFVYREGEPPLFHDGPCKSIYSSEGSFIHGLEMDKHFLTSDPEKAHVFFLPFSVTMLVSFVYSDIHGFDPVKRTVVDYIKVIAEKYPYWNRSLGADHFMLSCHDKGPKVSRAVSNLAKNSIRVLCNANTSRGFVPSKDVSLPEINLVTGSVEGFLGGPGPSSSKRTILAFFAGGRHGRIRPVLLQHWLNKDPSMQVHQYLPKEVSYYEMMKKSKYCLCPSGYEVASPRIVEALYVGCVPVLLSRSYVAPFSDVLNWKAFSVIVPVEDIPNLKHILSNISPENYTRMQRRGVQVRKHFVVNYPPKRFDVYHMILHSIWLRRLNIHIQ